MSLKYLKVSEVAKINKSTTQNASRFFSKNSNNLIERKNGRIISVVPDAVEIFFRTHGLECFYKPSIILSANLCGGVGKTSTIFNMGSFMRKILKIETPILFVDCDSQASLTSLVCNEPASDTEQQ